MSRGSPDATRSDWECTLEGAWPEPPALRLGLCRVKGLGEAAARGLMWARAQNPFDSVDDLVHRARWSALGIEDPPGMLRGNSAREPDAALPAPRAGAEIAYDYGSLGLSLRGHPLSLLRERLRSQRVLSAAELNAIEPGRIVRVAGIVMFRQRPATASGVLFISLEDETGVVNLIVWPKVFEAQRQTVIGANLLMCEGALQRESGVVHVIAWGFKDRSQWLEAIPHLSRDFR